MNYGASSSWAIARIVTMEGVPVPGDPSPEWAFGKFSLKKWPNDIATPEQVDRIVSLTEQGLKEGGIGIGIVPGYAPGSGYKELLAIQSLAAKYGVPTYSHVRSEGDVDPLSAAQAYGETISLAAATGAHVHICHLNSTSFGDIGLAVKMIQSAQRLVSLLKHTHTKPPVPRSGPPSLRLRIFPVRVSLTKASNINGIRLNKASYEALRASNPGATVVVHFYELPRDQELLDMSVLFPGGIIASDSMPWLNTKTGRPVDANVWPLPEDAFAHPRSAGTFARFLAEYVRDRRAISWSDAIPKTSYLPARYLEDAAPQMKKKGRLQVGMDADIVVFDPDTIQDWATYDRPNQTSVGMKDVFVNGVFIIRDGSIDAKALPGRPVRRPTAQISGVKHDDGGLYASGHKTK